MLPIVGILLASRLLASYLIFGIILLVVSAITIPLVVLFRSRKISTYKDEWTARQVVGPSVEPSPQSSGPAANDESLLQATSSLSQLLSIVPVNPTRVQWIDYIAMGRGGSIRVEADKPMIGGKVITLPLRFKD